MTDRAGHPTDDADDAELWRRVRADDADAFGALFERHGPRIHGYVLRRGVDPAAAEDVTALTFLEAWRRRATAELRHASVVPWLYGVAGNVVRHRRRSARRHAAALERLAALPPAAPAPVERQAEAMQRAHAVVEQVHTLPAREREVLVLSVWEGLTHAEIADALGIAEGTVKSRLSRARARLDPDPPVARARPVPPSTTRP